MEIITSTDDEAPPGMEAAGSYLLLMSTLIANKLRALTHPVTQQEDSIYSQ